jgi:hypothetical protein
VLLLVVAAGFAAVCSVEAWLDAPTYDEPVYVSAGVLAMLHGDLVFNEEHPPLAKVLAALPVLAADPVIPPTAALTSEGESTYGARFVDAQIDAGKLRTVTFLSRLVPILEAIAAAFVLYALGRDLFGPAGGALAGVLWLADPLTIGLGHLDGVDLPFALSACLVSLALLRWLRRGDGRRVLLVGIACGLAVSCAPTGLLLLALATVIVGVGGWRGNRLRALLGSATVVLTALVLVWAVYAALDPGVLLHLGVLPQPYLDGVRQLRTQDAPGKPAYLLGFEWVGRRLWYWPGSVLVKMPWPTLLVLVAGPFTWWAATKSRSGRREGLVAVVLPAVVLGAFTVVEPQDIGVRYLLPVIALWLVACSAIVTLGRRVAGALVLCGLGALACAMSATSVPDSLAWTNPPFTPGYREATDSNLDWGQDFYLLEEWSAGRDPYISYWGTPGLEDLAIPGARPLVATDPRTITGWVAASSTSLMYKYTGALSWLHAYCPVGTLGGSILLYRFEEPPSGRPGPHALPGLCAGPYSYRVTQSAG